MHAGTVANRNALEVHTRRARRSSQFADRRRHLRFEPLSRADQCLTQALRSEGLEKVVHGVHLECTQGIFVEGRHKNHTDVASDKLEHFETI
jgi:hypothetical protein